MLPCLARVIFTHRLHCTRQRRHSSRLPSAHGSGCIEEHAETFALWGIRTLGAWLLFQKRN